MLKLLTSLLMQLFFSKPPGIPVGMLPPNRSTFQRALDIEFKALRGMPPMDIPKTAKVSHPPRRYAETRYAKDDSTFSL